MPQHRPLFDVEPDPFREPSHDTRSSEVREVVARAREHDPPLDPGDRDTLPVLPSLELRRMQAEWRTLDVDLSVRALRLASKAVHDPTVAAVLGPVRIDAQEVTDALYVLCVEALESFPEIPPPTAAFYHAIREVYAWLIHVVDQVGEAVETDGGDLDSLSFGLGPLVAYSGLYVRWLLEPLLRRSLESFARIGDRTVVRRLDALLAAVLRLNASMRGFART